MAIKLGGGGGVSVPIGGDLSLLDTANTVTKGSEVFLRTGLTASSSTYPDAPVKSFINNGTLAAQSDYDTSISPWQGDSTASPNVGGAMADTSTGELFVVTDNGYANKFTSYGTTFVGARNLRDGTVFPTTASSAGISCVGYGTTSRAQGSNMPATNLRAFISGNGGTLGVPAIAYLSNDLQTHYGTYNLTAVSGYDWTTSPQYIKAAFVSSTQLIVLQPSGNGYPIQFTRYPVPSLSSTSGSLTHERNSIITEFDHLFSWHPELIPHTSNPALVGFINNETSSQGQKIYYYNGTSNFPSTAIAYSYYSAVSSYDTGNISSTSTSTYRAPFLHGSHGLKVMRNNVTATFAADIGNVTNNRIYTALAFSSTGYRGYAFKNANTVYVGHSNENKAFAIHPTTNVLGASIDMSSQAAPYRLAHHNNVLYNLNGTNIHTYSTTSNAFVSTIDISNKVSGTNAVGIAHDGTNLYVLDGSNSKIHKYNATGSSYVSFVTLSDTPHTSSTLVSLAVDSTNSVFYVTDDTNCSLYALDGTAKVASVSAGWEDSEVHNGHLVGMQTSSTTQTKIPTVDVVGNPSGSLGAVSTTYYRVS
jgi:hypothetical protein